MDSTRLNILGQRYTGIVCKTNLHCQDSTGLVFCGVIEIHRNSVQNSRVCLRRLDLFSVPLACVCFFARCHVVDTSDCMQTVRVSANVGRCSKGQPRSGPSY